MDPDPEYHTDINSDPQHWFETSLVKNVVLILCDGSFSPWPVHILGVHSTVNSRYIINLCNILYGTWIWNDVIRIILQSHKYWQILSNVNISKKPF